MHYSTIMQIEYFHFKYIYLLILVRFVVLQLLLK